MLKTAIYKFKTVWAHALANRGRSDARPIRGKFHKPSNSVLMRAEKSTKAGENDEEQCKLCQQLIESIFGPVVTINDTYLPKTTVNHTADAPVPCPTDIESKCVKCEQLIDDLFTTNETLAPGRAQAVNNPLYLDKIDDTLLQTNNKQTEEKFAQNIEVIETPDVRKIETFDNPLDVDHIYDVYALQSTNNEQTEKQLTQNIEVIDKIPATYETLDARKIEAIDNPLDVDHIYDVYALQTSTDKQAEEKLQQKIEVIDETPLVEAEKQNIDGFNVAPRVLGQITTYDATLNENVESDRPAVNFNSNDSNQNRKSGAADAVMKNAFDALAKRCLESPTSRIDEQIIKEMKKLGVPQTVQRENSRIQVQMDVIKKRTPVKKTEVELEATKLEREPSPMSSKELHPAIQLTPGITNPSVYQYDPVKRELVFSELNALTSDVIEFEMFNSDIRPKLDSNQVIIDPFDKKTIAYDTETYGYEPLEPLSYVQKQAARTQTSYTPFEDISQELTHENPIFTDQKSPIQATRLRPDLGFQNTLYLGLRKELTEAATTEQSNVDAEKIPEPLVAEGTLYINRQTSIERPNLVMSLLDVKERTKANETKSEPSYSEVRNQFSRSFAQRECCVDPLTNEKPCDPADFTEKCAVTLDPLPELNPKGQTISLNEMLRRVRQRSRMQFAEAWRLKRQIIDPDGKCEKIKPKCPPDAPQCPPTAPERCPRPCRPDCPPPRCPSPAEPPPCRSSPKKEKPKDPCASIAERDPCGPASKVTSDPCGPASKPKSDPCAPASTPKADPCAPASKPKSDPCGPTLTPKKDPRGQASKPKTDACGPALKLIPDPYANLSTSTYLGVSLDNILPVVLSNTPTETYCRNSSFSCKSANLVKKTVVTNVPLFILGCSQLSTNSCSRNFGKCELKLENVVHARSFEPWVPIPSWPTPKKPKNEQFVCPKEGCKARPQPHLDPCETKAGEPCSDFPRPRRNFSLTDLDSTFFNIIGNQK